MIYHKVELSNGRYVNIDVYGDDLFTRCPDCGIEQEVDQPMLKSIVDGHCDFGSTSFYCPDCTQKHLKE